MKKVCIAALAAVSASLTSGNALAQTEPYAGQVMIVAFEYCPDGWMEPAGQILPINQYQVLYSLFGNTYGGDPAQKTFALPDLRDRTVVGNGAAANYTPRKLGDVLGAEETTLQLSQMPKHSHDLDTASSTAKGDHKDMPAMSMSGAVNKRTTSTAGEGEPFSNYQPSLVLHYCMAVTGYYPSRP